MKRPLKLAMLGSTRGSILPPIVQALRDRSLNAEIAMVLSNQPNAFILERARALSLPHVYVPVNQESRDAYDARVSQILQDHHIDFILLIGYMRILSRSFVDRWAEKILNVHPSLLPEFPGLMDLDVHRAVIDAKKTISGCTIHYVTHEVDAGPILIQKTCPVFSSDTPERLKSRVQALEADAFLEAIQLLERETHHDPANIHTH